MQTIREHIRQVMRYMTDASITFDVYLEEFDKPGQAPYAADEVFDVMHPPVVQRNGEEGTTLSPRRIVKARPFYQAIEFAKQNNWRVSKIDLVQRTIHFAKDPL